MSLLRIECPDCGAEYADSNSAFTEQLGYWYEIHCIGCEHFAAKRDNDRGSAAQDVIKKYLTPTALRQSLAREGWTG